MGEPTGDARRGPCCPYKTITVRCLRGVYCGRMDMNTQRRQRRTTLEDELKPLMRGWFHGAGTLGALAFTLLMGWVCLELGSLTLVETLPFVIFGVAMIVLFGVSAVYHLGDGMWSPRVCRVLQTIDHSVIYGYIAASFTPIVATALSGWARISVLAFIWVLAIGGVAMVISPRKLPRWTTAGLYVLMGWTALFLLPSLSRLLPWEALGLMVLGGTLYTVGAVLYALKRPNPFPGILGFHEVFHLLVVAGCASFGAVVWVWVLPMAIG